MPECRAFLSPSVPRQPPPPPVRISLVPRPPPRPGAGAAPLSPPVHRVASKSDFGADGLRSHFVERHEEPEGRGEARLLRDRLLHGSALLRICIAWASDVPWGGVGEGARLYCRTAWPLRMHGISGSVSAGGGVMALA